MAVVFGKWGKKRLEIALGSMDCLESGMDACM